MMALLKNVTIIERWVLLHPQLATSCAYGNFRSRSKMAPFGLRAPIMHAILDVFTYNKQLTIPML